MNTVSRWLVGVLVPAFLALTVGGGWFLRVQEQEARREVESDLRVMARLKTDQIVQWREERLSDAAMLMESPLVRDAIALWLWEPKAESAESILAQLRSMQKHGHYFDIMLVDGRGEVRLSLHGTVPQNHEDVVEGLSTAFREKRPVLTDLHAGPGDLPPHLESVAPIFSGEGETAVPMGAILLQCDARRFLYPMIQAWPTLSRSAETLLVRRDGEQVLYLNSLRHQEDAVLKLRIPLSRSDLPAVMAVQGREGVVVGRDYRGVEVIAVLRAIPGSSWFMVAKMDEEEAMAEWRLRSILMGALMLMFLAAAAAAVGMVLQRDAKVHYRTLFQAEAALRESEERYGTTLMSVGDGVIVTDVEGRVSLLNPVAEVLTGWRQEQARGKNMEEVFRIVNEETRQTVEDPVAQVLRDGLLVGLANHTVLISRDGREFPIADSAAPICDETGKIHGVVLVFRDQTREREAEAALQAVSARYQALLAAIPDIIMEVDANKVYTWANQAGLDFFGEDVVGKEAGHYFEGEQATYSAVEALFHGREDVIYVESWQRRKDGRKCLLAWWCRVLKDASGEVCGAISSARDITDRKRREDLVRVRLSLLEFAAAHSLDELLQKTLDEIGSLTDSPIGFYHFVEEDQKTLSLQAWSTQTLQDFCKAEGKGLHYPIDQAGIWVDCFHEKRPVIHNDYLALPHRRGMPEGHAAVIRELVVPVMRSNRVVAILGIGNKPTDYTQEDLEYVSFLADTAWEITVQKRMEEERQQSEESYRLLARNVPGVVYRGYADGGVEFFDDRIETIIGYPAELLSSQRLKWISLIHMEDMAQAKSVFLQALWGEREYVREYRIKHRDERYVWIQERGQIVCRDDGRIHYISGILFDITDRKRAEEEKEKTDAQLRQSQKMEAVGRLAGGVAHDFNNMLGVILGYTDLALARLKPYDPVYADLQQVQSAAGRSAELTRQLLAFSRRQTIAPRSLDLNEQTQGMERLLGRIIGEDIDLRFQLREGLWPVYMDPAQVDQIVANLAVNSRDAMPGGGKLTLETANLTFDEVYCEAHVGFTPGDFVMLAVSDTGCGMDKETLDHVFEPFFTTKPEGKGTGLGLATVYGIVKQNKGFINIYSEPGEGTTIKVYIPRHRGQEVQSSHTVEESKPERGCETILVVEDESQMRLLAKAILERLGYRVLDAGGPGEAIALCEKYVGEIHLLLTDVVMPIMNGKELEGRVRAIKPGVKTLFMSGYTDDAIAHRGVLEKGAHFLQKPFLAHVLAKKVRDVLAAPSTSV